MPLVTSREILAAAQAGGYAIGAFNVENMEMAQAVIAAAEELRAPVMLQTTPSTVRYASTEVYFAIVAALAGKAGVPVVIHLDHGESYELAASALAAGYTSVMIDGSHVEYEENIALTKRVVQAAAEKGVPVEAELGKVGGKEDDMDGGAGGYTVPEEALDFVTKTGVSSLAVAIGTAHGVYSGVPCLDVERLIAIRRLVDIPLVLHGASGLSDEAVISCIKQGICKVNFATELRQAYSGGVREALSQNPGTFDPKVYGKAGRDRVTALVRDRITVCGSAGKC